MPGGSQGIGARKGDHKVRERQQETRVVMQPCFGLVILALGTVSMLAGVIAVMVSLTWRTGKELAAKSLGATLLDVPHGVKMRGRHTVAEFGSVRCAVDAEDVSNLYHSRLLITWLTLRRNEASRRRILLKRRRALLVPTLLRMRRRLA